MKENKHFNVDLTPFLYTIPKEDMLGKKINLKNLGHRSVISAQLSFYFWSMLNVSIIFHFLYIVGFTFLCGFEHTGTINT